MQKGLNQVLIEENKEENKDKDESSEDISNKLKALKERGVTKIDPFKVFEVDKK